MLDKHNKMRADKLSLLALHKWGKADQIPVFMEELAELSVAISHANRGRNGWRAELLEEMADVEIIMRELHILFDVSEDDLEDEITRKLDKFERHIKYG